VRFSPFLAASTFLASSVFAQGGTGSITGELALDPVSWTVAVGGDGPTSSWSEDQNSGSIRLVGTPDGNSDGGAGTLIIEMDVAKGPQEPNPTDIRIALQRSEDTLIANSENIDLTLESFQIEGSDIVLAGSFVATMAEEPKVGLVLSPDEGTVLDGNFQATVRQ